MSNISTALDAIKAKLETIFPENQGYIQITNPYNLADNADQMRDKGWGVAVGAGSDTNRNLGCKLSIARSITVVLCRMSEGLELNTVNKEGATKALLEDHFTLVKEITNDVTLQNATSGITKFVYNNDGGIEFVENAGERFFVINSVFDLEYFESLN